MRIATVLRTQNNYLAHLDHLAPLAEALNATIIVCNRTLYEHALQFYPMLKFELINGGELPYAQLAKNYDVLIHTNFLLANRLKSMFQLFYNKTMYFIYSPHGNSEKGFDLRVKLDEPGEDISLVYGEQMELLYKKNGQYNNTRKLLRTGNLRPPFYKKYNEHFDSLAEEHIFSKVNMKKRVLLYAPTWNDNNLGSSCEKWMEKVIQEGSETHTLIIKPHPNQAIMKPETHLKLASLISSTKDVFLLETFPVIYPLLARVDGLIGDFSSICYDFLHFDRPLYFLDVDRSPGKGRDLFRAGMVIPEQEHIGQFIDRTFDKNQNLNKGMRKSFYDFAFDPIAKTDHILPEIKKLHTRCGVKSSRSN